MYFDPKVPIIYGTWALRENLTTPKDSTGPISATMPHSKNEPELIEFIGRPRHILGSSTMQGPV